MASADVPLTAELAIASVLRLNGLDADPGTIGRLADSYIRLARSMAAVDQLLPGGQPPAAGDARSRP